MSTFNEDYSLWLAGIKPRFQYPGEQHSALITKRQAPAPKKTLKEMVATRYFAIALNQGGVIYMSDADMMERFGVIRSMGEMLPDQSGYIQKVLTPEQMGQETLTGMMNMLPSPEMDSPIPFGLLRSMPAIAASAEPPQGDPMQEGIHNYHQLSQAVRDRMAAIKQALPMTSDRAAHEDLQAELHDIDNALETNDWQVFVTYGFLTSAEADRIAAEVMGESRQRQVRESAPAPTTPRRSLSQLASALRR